MANPLTENEFNILQLMWEEGRALSRPEIIEKTPEKDWNPNSIHLILNNMIEKGVLCVEGLTRCGRGYGRTYAPTMTQMEYAAAQAIAATPDMDTGDRLVGIFTALIEKEGIDTKAISSLEAMLKQQKKAITK